MLGLIRLPPALQKAYRRNIKKNDGRFMCFDGSQVIDVSKLNDNFKDCSDASDEPLTALGISGKFVCGKYFPKTISQWSINDGICDCCDGSDEANNTHAKCPDTCDIEYEAYVHFKKLIKAKLEASNFSRKSLSKLKEEEKHIKWIDEHTSKGKEFKDDLSRKLFQKHNERAKLRIEELKAEIEESGKDYTQSPFNARQKQFMLRWPYEIRSSGTSLGRFRKVKDGKAIFDGGDYCWQTRGGRRTTADLYCGSENRLLSVTEREPCVFHAGIVSPRFCDGDSIDALDEAQPEEIFEIAKMHGFDVNSYTQKK